MKLISWNVNGLRACIKKGFMEILKEVDADIFCMQETKMEKGQADEDFTLEGIYNEYWHSAVKKGYSGTAVFSKMKPISESYGIGIDEHDQEGRVITLEFEEFYLVNVYVPNSKRELLRLDYRMKWEEDFKNYLIELDKKKPVVVCGDLNVAHQEIDIKNAKSNRRNAGFTDEEREKMSKLLESGFRDTYRDMHPDNHDAYTWWSFMGKAREKNIGWRIDYFLVSNRFMERITESQIYPEVYGSDHCPIGIIID